MKLKIGIFPIINDEEVRKASITYQYVTSLVECIEKVGGIPICLTFKNEKINMDQLKMCDALIFPGGKKINAEAYEVLKYAFKKKIPTLGICLGMQTLAIFSKLLKDNCFTKSKLKEAEELVLNKIASNNHFKESLVDDNIYKTQHKIFIEPTSLLYEFYQNQIIKVVSLHNYEVVHIENIFKVTAFSPDGVLEAIESSDKNWLAIGVQFHPEYDKENILIEKFMKKIIERK